MPLPPRRSVRCRGAQCWRCRRSGRSQPAPSCRRISGFPLDVGADVSRRLARILHTEMGRVLSVPLFLMARVEIGAGMLADKLVKRVGSVFRVRLCSAPPATSDRARCCCCWCCGVAKWCCRCWPSRCAPPASAMRTIGRCRRARRPPDLWVARLVISTRSPSWQARQRR